MASVKILLRNNKKKANGDIPLFLRITKNRKSKFVSTGYAIPEKYWDNIAQRVKQGYPNAVRLNNLLAKMRKDAEDIALDMDIHAKALSSINVKKQLKGDISQSFLKYADTKIESLKKAEKFGTYKWNKGIISKLKIFMNGSDLAFEDITVKFLNDYEVYCIGYL